MGGERMTEEILWIAAIFILSGVFWYFLFFQKEKRLLNRLQQMLDYAIGGELKRTEISEEKYSALENSMKQYLDSNNHVNNTVYALWTEDILPEGACAKEVRIDYRKAAMFKETIQVFVQQQEDIFKVKYIKPDGEIAALVEMTLKTIED